MQNVGQELRQLNIEIGERESLGDQEFFEKLLGPVFVIRRADGKIQDRAKFIEKVSSSSSRETAIHSVSLLGEHRALVQCTVRVLDSTSPPPEYHNVRLFAKDTESGSWMLLAWANESVR